MNSTSSTQTPTLLAIHALRKEYFDLELTRYGLTFDDGLYSQYYYHPAFENHPTKRFYFIVTSLIRPGPARPVYEGTHLPYVKSRSYMHQAFVENNRQNFMTIEEIQHLSRRPGVRIGAHSHFHDVILTRTHPHRRKPVSSWKLSRISDRPLPPPFNEFSIRSRLAFQGYEYRAGRGIRRSASDWRDYVKRDTELCLQWFDTHLGFTPHRYCFPFNEHNRELITVLRTFGFREFYSGRPGNCPEVKARLDIDALSRA